MAGAVFRLKRHTPGKGTARENAVIKLISRTNAMLGRLRINLRSAFVNNAGLSLKQNVATRILFFVASLVLISGNEFRSIKQIATVSI